MKTIHKFPFSIFNHFGISLPKDAVILSAQMQDEQPCIWALVDTEQEIEKREFILFGTGHPIYHIDELKYVATFQQAEFVWHLFEVIAD